MPQLLPESEATAEAERLMTICNACRYCEGHCAVFPAMTQRLAFPPADLGYLANLCHGCGSCYHHCQYAEPHEFDVNVPRTMAEVRLDTYEAAAWPAALGRSFRSNGVVTAIVTALAVALFQLATALLVEPDVLFGAHGGDFYRVIPHGVMAGLFGAVALFVLVAIGIGMARFWRLIGAPPLSRVGPRDLGRAVHDAFTLKYLGGGADLGCTYPGEAPSQLRRRFHHLTFYGFLLCFAATTVGTLYHYGFGWVAPYGYLSLPSLLGTLGGLGLLAGPAGLLFLKRRSAAAPIESAAARTLDEALLVLLLLTALTGLALTVLRDTDLLGVLLVIHLGVVMALFLAMPYGKFMHGFYRLLALIGYALEQRAERRMIGSSGAGEAPRQAAE